MTTLAEIALRLQTEVIGDATVPITSVAPIEEAGPTDITWAEDARRLAQAAAGSAGAIVVPKGSAPVGKPLLPVAHPRQAFIKLLEFFAPAADIPHGIDPSASIAEGAVLGEGVGVGPHASVAAGAVIGAQTSIAAGVHVGREARIGAYCLLHAGVVVRDRVSIGDRVIIQPGAVIGSDGFGYVSYEGAHHKMPHIGTVIVEDDVEIGANVTIDRATCGATRIGRGTKIDNLVQVGHNVQIGSHCLIVALTGIAGSATLGNWVTLAGQTGIVGHLHIGDHSLAYARTVVDASLPANSIVSGNPARPHGEQLRAMAKQRRMPDELAALKARVEQLEAALARTLGELDTR